MTGISLSFLLLAMVACNTTGGIVGTIVTGFVLVPALGLVHTLGALAIAASGVDHPDVIALR